MTNKEEMNVLHVSASARGADSVSRRSTRRLIEHLQSQQPIRVTERNVALGLPFVEEQWVAANFTAPDARTAEQQKVLGQSDALVEEIEAADVLVIGTPIYNFAIPASLKAWIDMVVRAARTFRYTENGPLGLLENKRAFIVIASGGTKIGSEIDYASDYLRHILGFIGIEDVQIIAADTFTEDGLPEPLRQQIQELAA